MNDDFYGLAVGRLENQHLKLDYLSESGPRIVRLKIGESRQNLLAEIPDMHWDTPFGKYLMRGGHRLWHSPESFPRTYIPDNAGLQVEQIESGVRLVQPVEASTGIRKMLEVVLETERPAVHLKHYLKNEGLWPIELSPWAITQLPLGGVAILPQQVGALDFAGLLPNRQLVLWPYTRWSDPRLEMHDDFILLRGQAYIPPCKVGYTNRAGWAAYLRNGVLFCKRFDPKTHLTFPDFGSNVECYCNDRFIEVETLGPFTRLEPGDTVSHSETWEVYSLKGDKTDIEAVREAVESLEI